jgi:hypothetical protein
MKLIALAVIAAACAGGACGLFGGAKKPDAGAGSGSAAPIRVKKIVLSWGISQGPTSADVFLQTTDETGAQVSHPLGTFPGKCTPATPEEGMNALLAVVCLTVGTGTELYVGTLRQQVVITRLHVAQGVKPDPMAREELTRFDAPPGADIVVNDAPLAP